MTVLKFLFVICNNNAKVRTNIYKDTCIKIILFINKLLKFNFKNQIFYYKILLQLF